MNVFALDAEPALAARAHCDKHVNKMILESVQILNTSLHQEGHDEHHTSYYKLLNNWYGNDGWILA